MPSSNAVPGFVVVTFGIVVLGVALVVVVDDVVSVIKGSVEERQLKMLREKSATAAAMRATTICWLPNAA